MRKINFLFLILFLLVLTGCNENSGNNSKEAKDFKLKSLTSDKYYNLSEFSGKPVILNFWASWCAPCRQEMPFLESVWKEHKDKDLVLVGINVMDDNDEARETLKEFKISYPNLSDTRGDVTDAYDILALPVTYFINKQGEVSKINYGPFLGKSGEERFNNNLQEILK